MSDKSRIAVEELMKVESEYYTTASPRILETRKVLALESIADDLKLLRELALSEVRHDA